MKYLTKEFTSSVTDIPMMARLVRPGEGMGRWDKNTQDFSSSNKNDELLVEFFDKRHD